MVHRACLITNDAGCFAGAFGQWWLSLRQGIREQRLERADQIPLIAVLCRHLREHAPC